ncbi:MAG: exosortase/archaeosortase family protein [Pirellulales bacterium]|nr:exosortase/archaeosortase family protein [Pirellulales bacterium]
MTLRQRLPNLVIGGAILVGVFAWAYWPTLVEFARTWVREPDYSHGFLVLPLALFFLWARRDRFPGLADRLAWPGVALILLSLGMRIFSAWVYVDAVDGWSLLVWTAGVVWLFGGARVLWWSLPSIAFLWFMVPLPWRLERMASLPLQRVATKLSCWTLQSLGQPALAEGNTILLGEHRLEVEQACSGLAIFLGVIALAFAYVILVRRPWWERALLLISVVPISLIANATRIVVTGLLYQTVSGDAGYKFSHDIAGLVMIPYAAGLFALVLWYLGKLMREVQVADVSDVLRPDRV